MSPRLLAIVVARLPGLDHALPSIGPAAAAARLDALLSLAGAHDALAVRREGEQVVLVFEDPPRAALAALDLVGRRVVGEGVAAAFGVGDALLIDDEVFGAEAASLRRLAGLARVGEVLCTTDEPLDLPQGVGSFLAPAALRELVRRPLQVLRDYR